MFLWKISKYVFFCLEKGAIWRYKFNENLERKIDKKLLIPGVIHTSHTLSHARRAPTVLSQETALETTVHTAFLATVAGLARKHSKWWTSNFLCLQTPRALRFNSGHWLAIGIRLLLTKLHGSRCKETPKLFIQTAACTEIYAALLSQTDGRLGADPVYFVGLCRGV